MIITLWPLAHDCLPSGQQLCHGRIPASDACIFCGREERAEHTVLFYQYTLEVWLAVEKTLPVSLGRDDFYSSKEWLLVFWTD